MRIDKRNSSFSNIGTVVFYKHHRYIPDALEQIPSEFRDFSASMVKYHGSTTNFHGINFAEYDFSYIIEKYKFDNRLLVSDLDTESLDLVGKNINDTDKIGKILFPTLVDEETNKSYEFFGSLSISGRDLYFIECPEDYQTIEIYEDILESNIIGSESGFIEYQYLVLEGRTDIIEPAAVIHLGPERKAYNNPTEFYFNNDPLKSRINRTELEYTTLEYSKLCDEIWSKKVICFFLSTSGDILDFNLSYAAWEENDNPQRNKWKFELRNDEFFDIIKPDKSIVEKDGSIYLDKKSNTILGNSEISSSLCPLMSRKLDRLRRTQSQYYSPYRKYAKGENTTYRILKQNGTYVNYILESLVSGNIGNDPLLSPAWILRDKFLDFISNIIYISLNPASSGSIINPGTQITVRGDSNINFSIIDGLGYMFSGVSIITPNQETIDLVEGDDYLYTLEDTDSEYNKTVMIDGWSSYIDPESPKYTNNLVFNFTERPSIIKFLVLKDGVIYHYEDWTSTFGDNFGMILKLNNNIIDPPSSSNDYLSPISYDNGDMFLFIDNPETNPTLEIDFTGSLIKQVIKSKYRIGNRKYTKEISINDDIATDINDFSNADYIISLESVERLLSVRYDSRLIRCDTNGLISVDYNTDRTISFKVAQDYIPSISLVNFWYDDNNRLVKHDNELIVETCPFNGNLELEGNIVVGVNLDQDDDGKYYLELTNITENTIIQISGVKIE